MKLRSAFLCALAALGLLTSCGKEENEVTPAPVALDKTVTFEIFAHKDYSSSHYADHEATIHLSIRRTDKATMQETILYDTTFTKALKDIPLKANQLLITKKLSVVTQNEWIGIGSGFRVGAAAYGSYESLQEEQLAKKVEVVL